MQQAAIEYVLPFLGWAARLIRDQGTTGRSTGEPTGSSRCCCRCRRWRWSSAVQHRKPAGHRLRWFCTSVITKGAQLWTVWTRRSRRHTAARSFAWDRWSGAQVEHGRLARTIWRWRRGRRRRRRECFQCSYDQRRHNEWVRWHELVREQPTAASYSAAQWANNTTSDEEQSGPAGSVLDSCGRHCL
jgi:hypothetical protein